MNRQWTLAREPTAAFPQLEDFKMVESPVPSPGPGQMLTRTIYLSLDPYQWGYTKGGGAYGARANIIPGDGSTPETVMHGRTVSQVVESNIDGFKPGDYVFNTNGWQEFGLTGEGVTIWNYMRPRKLEPSASPISTAVGILGMLGMTAWSGIKIQCDPQPGETVVVSAASGGVGQCAGQIAKQLGARVVGIAGPGSKCEFVTEVLGFDACVSYRSESFAEDLAAACPDGCDVYFENVGGDVWAAVLPLLNTGARVTRCGLMSQQVSEGGGGAKEWEAQGAEVIAARNVRVQALFVGTAGGAAAQPGDAVFQEHEAEFLATMGDWIASGKVKYKEDLRMGLENAPSTFRALLSPGDVPGATFGKTLIGVGHDPTLNDGIVNARGGSNVLRPSL